MPIKVLPEISQPHYIKVMVGFIAIRQIFWYVVGYKSETKSSEENSLTGFIANI